MWFTNGERRYYQMSYVITSVKRRLYGKDFRLDVVAESPEKSNCCYEIYDSDSNYIGSACNMDEVYEVIREITM